MSPQPLERIESLPAFLAREGLEVVRDEWGPFGSYAVLWVRRPEPPNLEPCAYCEHARALHEDGGRGECIAIDCACEVFTPALPEEG